MGLTRFSKKNYTLNETVHQMIHSFLLNIWQVSSLVRDRIILFKIYDLT